MAVDFHNYIERHCGPNSNIVLVGHSMGGKAAISLACKYPQKVKGVISIDLLPQNRGLWPELNESTINMVKRGLALGDLSDKGFEGAKDYIMNNIDDMGLAPVLVSSLDKEGKWKIIFKALRNITPPLSILNKKGAIFCFARTSINLAY